MGLTLFRKKNSTNDLKSQRTELLDDENIIDVASWKKPQIAVLPVEAKQHKVKEDLNDQSSVRFPNKKKLSSFRLSKFTKSHKNRKKNDNMESPSRLVLLDNQKASDMLTPAGKEKNYNNTPPTGIMTILDSSQQSSLSPERRQFLSERRTPKKPYRRYDDTAEDDPCFLDDYDDFVSLFSSTNIATVKKQLFEGRKTIKRIPTTKLNELELQLQSFNISHDEFSCFPLDENETTNSTNNEQEEYYVSRDQRQPSNTTSLRPEPSIRRQLSNTFDEMISQFDDSFPIPSLSSNLQEEMYGDVFTSAFLKSMVNVGKKLLLYVKARNNPSDWRHTPVFMNIVMNKTHCAKFHQPQLRISLVRSHQNKAVAINLMDIHSIKTMTGNAAPCFTILTESGDMYILEASSTSEKETIVNGLKNTISRFSFHVVSGSMTTKQSLSTSCGDESCDFEYGELPSLKTSSQTLTDITMKLLE